MKKIFNYSLALLAILCLTGTASLAQSTKWTEKTAQQWVKKGEWRHGLKQMLFADVDAVEFAKQYHRNKALWDKAFAFIRDTNLDTLSPGKHIIDGENVFATVTEGAITKDFDKSGWESHRNYNDIHLMIKGKEKVGMAAVATATVTNPYNETKDLANYTAEGKFYIGEPGIFYLFFPTNAHRPNIKVDGYDNVKKLVIKVSAK